MAPSTVPDSVSSRPFASVPRLLPYIGASFRIQRDPVGYLQKLALTYGDLVGFHLMGRPAFLLSHPDYIREVLVGQQVNFTKSPALQRARRLLGDGLLTSEGEYHLRQRRLIQPAFYRERLQAYAGIIIRFGLEARDRWQPGQPVDMLSEMMRLTLRIVVQALFGADPGQNTSAVATALAEVEHSFRYLLLPFANLLFGLPLPVSRRFERAKSVLDETVYRIIRQRHDAPENASRDLLSALMAERDEQGAPLTRVQLRDEILTLFLAGHETTAICLTWTWYLLARNPECEQRMHAEIDSVVKDSTRVFDDIPRLPYTESILSESMRLFPPVWNIGRLSRSSFDLGDVTIPAGSICLMSQYVVHHDPRFYPDPERFDPSRWASAARESRPKFSYFPFGGGARVCIGERFAWTEMILLLATLSQKWRLRLTQPEPVELKPLITLHPRTSMRMIPELR